MKGMDTHHHVIICLFCVFFAFFCERKGGKENKREKRERKRHLVIKDRFVIIFPPEISVQNRGKKNQIKMLPRGLVFCTTYFFV